MLQAASEVAQMGCRVQTFFEEQVERFLPFVDTRCITPTRCATPGSDTSEKAKPKKKRKTEEISLSEPIP